MSGEDLTAVDPRIQVALQELEARIHERYPQARFDVFHGADPEGVYLRATVAVDDTDAVLDVVLDQLYEFQVEQGLPVHVVTTLLLARVAEQLRERTTRPGMPLLPHFLQV